MTARNFLGAVAATTLNGGINSGATSIAVTDGSTYPSANFTIVIDRGLVGEEKVFISSRSTNTLTVSSRGYDGTTASAHSSGATVEHCATALDFQETNDHVQATTGHGATGAVVGTTNTQTLTNKTLTTPTLTVPVIADYTSAQHTHASAAQGGSVTTARGRIGSSVTTSATTGLNASTFTLLGSATGSVTLVAGRYYKISYDFYWSSTSAGTQIITNIVSSDSASTPSVNPFTATMYAATDHVNVGVNVGEGASSFTVLQCVASGATAGQINAGTHNFGVAAKRDASGASGTPTVTAGSGAHIILLVEDIGT